jgi:hypothetical protein
MLGFLPLSAAAISEDSITTLVTASGAINGRALVTAAGTKTVSASGAILGRAVVTAAEGAIQGSAAVTGRAVVTALGGYSRSAVAAIVGTATVTATGGIAKFASAQIVGVGTFTAIANNDVFASAAITAEADVRCVGGVRRSTATGSISARAVVVAEGMIYGEEWTKVSPVSDTWQRQE